jgi:CRISPR-associated protein Csb1
LSAYIEAKNPQQANWGGVKRERIFDQAESGTTDAESGFGSIPFPRTDFTARGVRAFFSLDLQLLRTLALGEREERQQNGKTTREPKCRSLEEQGNFTNEEAFLILWSLYKIENFLDHGLTLRSNCQFGRGTLHVEAPSSFPWPSPTELTTALESLRNVLFPIKVDEEDIWKRRNVLTVTWSGTAPPPAGNDQAPVSSDTADQPEGEDVG